MAQKILIVEDEVLVSSIINDYLLAADFATHIIDNGNEVLEWVKLHTPDLIILDVMLPGKNGLEVCKELRTFSEVPILLVTAKTQETDRLIGIESGADDYICKPYSPREVVARVKMVLRRATKAEIITAPKCFHFDDSRGTVSKGNRELKLTSAENKLLNIFISSSGVILSRNRILEQLHDDGRELFDRTVDSHVKKLRKKLALLLGEQKVIHSVYGAGYRFEWPE